MMEVS